MSIEAAVEEIKEDVKGILKIMNGNGGLGICAKVELHDSFIRGEKRKRGGLLDFAFRAIIFVLVSFIAVKVGMR